MAYILWKFQADSLKIEAWPIQNVEEFFFEQNLVPTSIFELLVQNFYML